MKQSRSTTEEKHAYEEPRIPELENEQTRNSTSIVTNDGLQTNASGHPDQLQRHYGLVSICGLALTIDNAWVAFGGSLTVSILNGGAPGAIYELLTACVYYAFIAASIAELASAMPTAGGVYHWATITPGNPRVGRMLGFFTGWLNFFGWIFDLASIVSIPANISVQFYVLFHPDFVVEPWHTYVAFLIITWAACATCIFGNRIMPYLQQAGLFLILVGGLVTIIVVAAMPKQHASSSFVWKDFDNQTGWGGGVAFLTGVLNGAFTIGTPDAVTHMAEELPNPAVDLPKAVAAQIILGSITALLFAITIFYGITDLSLVSSYSGSFPLAEVYNQATNYSRAATFVLLLIVFLSILICVLGTFLTVSRILWALGRDNAVPFPKTFGSVDEKLSCPIPATLFAALLCSGFGAISLGSKTAFTDLVGSFIILTSCSYLLAIGPHLLTGRKNVKPGPFWMGGGVGFVVNAASCLLIIFFDIMFCFPYAMPTNSSTMNYNSVILTGCLVLTCVWWFAHGMKHYHGPKIGTLHVIEGVGK